jgi:hypothetical protein
VGRDDSEGVGEEPCEEGRLEDGTGDGASDGTRDDDTDGTLDVALDNAGDEEAEAKWDDWDGDLVNENAVSRV